MRNRSRFIGFFIVVSAVVGLSFCSESSERVAKIYHPSEPVQGGLLVDAFLGEPTGLVPMIAGESGASAIGSRLYNSLLRYDKNLEIEGDLAISWQVSADNKTITFTLRDEVFWSDGEPLTSADVLFTWQLVTDPNTRTPYGADYKLIEKAEAPDARTFIIHYAQPFAPALDSWAGLDILPKHILAGQDINTSGFLRNPVGSGKYVFEKWHSGEQIVLKANPLATHEVPLITQRITRIIPDTAAQFLELLAENIDMMSLNPVQYARIFPNRPALDARIARYKQLGNGYTYMGFNLRREPFNDIRVRQALNYAIDKQEIIKGVLLGLGEPISSPYKPGTRWSNPALQPYPYDPEKAKQLLKEAGFRDEDGDGILERNGKPFSFEIVTNQNKQREMAAVLIQRRLQDVGIEVRVRILEWASFISQYINTGDFDVVMLGWGLGLEPDQYTIWHSSQQEPGQFNFLGYSNPEVDRLLEEGRQTLDVEARTRIYHEFAAHLLQDSPLIYLFAGYSMTAVNRRIYGIDETPPPAGIGHNDPQWYVPEYLRRMAMTP